MTFETEPEWMQKARQAPLRSTWESRQPPSHKPGEGGVLKQPSEAMS